MSQLFSLLEQLQDTNSVTDQLDRMMADNPSDEIYRINADALRKRQRDLRRRLDLELRGSQSDLIQYHIQRTEVDRYPALAIAKAIICSKRSLPQFLTPFIVHRSSGTDLPLKALRFRH